MVQHVNILKGLGTAYVWTADTHQGMLSLVFIEALYLSEKYIQITYFSCIVYGVIGKVTGRKVVSFCNDVQQV